MAIAIQALHHSRMTMEKRTIHKTGWEISEIGLGCWGLGGQYGEVDRSTALATVRAALESGINLFDTADAYGLEPGTSEKIVGQALLDVRDDVFVASKVGNWARRLGHPFDYSHPLHVVACCHASLHRLKTDTIDLYQCHISDLEEPDVFLEAFDLLVRQGAIRAWGISTNRLDVLERFNRDGNCAVCQLDYSLLNRTPEKDILPYCAQNRIATFIRGPLAQGILTGKYDEKSIFKDSVRSGWNEGRSHERYLEKLAAMKRYEGLTQSRTWPVAALVGVLNHPAVTSVIPGAKHPDQVLEQVQAAGQKLSEADKAGLDLV